MFRRFFFWTVLCSLIIVDLALALQPRYVRPKPEVTIFNNDVRADLIELKFVENSAVRLRQGSFISLDRTDLSTLNTFLADYSAVEIGSMFDGVSEEKLTQDKLTGQAKSGLELADLNLWYVCHVADESQSQDFVDGLNALDVVEIAYPAPIPETASQAIEKAPQTRDTPDFTDMQDYLYEAPVGVDASYAWTIPGGFGEDVKWIDVEIGWNWDHEDLPQPFFQGGPQQTDSHGTAVVGEVSGIHNGYGIDGIAPGAQVGCVYYDDPGYPNVSGAFYTAYENLDEGDAFLIELHAPGPGGDYICMEYWQANFDVIQTATANGVICVEAAGNGGANFDNPIYDGLFDRDVRDSGAIICGAADGYGLVRLYFSNYGSRLDSFGWGESVTTTGYGDLYGNNINEYYTAGFSGTSSASPICLGPVLCIQGIIKALGADVLTPLEIRALLTETGSPQQPNQDQYIGTRPDLYAAYQALGGNVEGNATLVGADDHRGVKVWSTTTEQYAISDSSGYYSITTLSQGSHNFIARRFGYYDDTVEDILVQPGETITDINFTLQQVEYQPHNLTATSELNLVVPLEWQAPEQPPAYYNVYRGNETGGPYDQIAEMVGETHYDDTVVSNGHNYFYAVTAVYEDPFGESDYSNEAVAAPGERIDPPFISDFEEDGAGLYLIIVDEGSGDTFWEHGTLDPTHGPGSAASGEKLWATGLSGNYNNDADIYLLTPILDFTEATEPKLTFDHWYEFQGTNQRGKDGGNLAVSTSAGDNWETIYPIDGYDDQGVPGLDQEPGFTGSSSDWVYAEYDLTDYAGLVVMIRFR
ncbi:MAG: hypothetical protein GY869_16915, partial [Planctomycetes bacterium]|nr:hypothetical protein [Planctomycetota bacterium]